MLRYRGTRETLKVVTQLDAFTKVPEEYRTSTKIGGTLSVLSRCLIIYLIYTEIIYYSDSNLVFKFAPDTDMDTRLKIHIDLTVAMPCRSIGADILDSTNQNIFSFGILEEDDTWWELSDNQREYFQYVQHLNGYLREEYHSVAELIFKEMVHKGEQKSSYAFPDRTAKPNRPYDACRIHGALTLNKVSGNFHVTAGKSLHFPRGHVHISSMFEDTKQNFSHRINRFSFGDSSSGIIHPLEGDEKLFTDSTLMIQYFIDVVPTDVHTFFSHMKTYQYSVKENVRPINHDKGSHGVPGLYFKYDMSALKITVQSDRENMVQFAIRLASIIAGIVVISGMINTFIQFVGEMVIKKAAPQSYQRLQNQQQVNVQIPLVGSSAPKAPVVNNLIANANKMVEIPCDFTIQK